MPSFTLGTTYVVNVFLCFLFIFLRSGVLQIWYLFSDDNESCQGLGRHSFESQLSIYSRYGELQCILVEQVLKKVKLCISSIIT